MTHPQPHTFVGTRGDTVVTLRVYDIYQAVLQGVMDACGAESVEQINLEGVDEIAIAQNTCVAVEKVVGIFPNIPRSND